METLCIFLLSKWFLYPFIILFHFFQVIQFLKAIIFVWLSLALYILLAQFELFGCFFWDIHTYMCVYVCVYTNIINQLYTFQAKWNSEIKGKISLFLTSRKRKPHNQRQNTLTFYIKTNKTPLNIFYLDLQPVFFTYQDIMNLFSSQEHIYIQRWGVTALGTYSKNAWQH